MAKISRIVQGDGIDELFDIDFEEKSTLNGMLFEEAECIDDLYYDKIASSALAFRV